MSNLNKIQFLNLIYNYFIILLFYKFKFTFITSFHWNFVVSYEKFLYPTDIRVAVVISTLGVDIINDIETKFPLWKNPDLLVVFITIYNRLFVFGNIG